MPRKPRLYLPGQPQHVVVRGHNRDPILARPGDFRFLYQCLREAALKNELAVHSWVFMHNHIHLLVTASHEQFLAKTMQSVGRRYAQYFNRCYHRSGSLWEGRYKSSLVDTDHYLLSCYRYIELNPVRAGLVRKPDDYAYSSYHANALGIHDSLLSLHSVFFDFISSHDQSINRELYVDLCKEILDRKTLTSIRRGTEKGIGIGRAEFILKISALRS
jgi:putative transposase